MPELATSRRSILAQVQAASIAHVACIPASYRRIFEDGVVITSAFCQRIEIVTSSAKEKAIAAIHPNP